MAGWVARGLVLAAEVGALPPRLTAEQKCAAREVDPRRKARNLRVLVDPTWKGMQGAKDLADRLHPTHQLWRLPGLIFCAGCGGYTSGSLRLLGSECERVVTSQRRTLLDRMQEGLHPKSKEVVGVPTPLALGWLQDATAAALAWLKPG